MIKSASKYIKKTIKYFAFMVLFVFLILFSMLSNHLGQSATLSLISSNLGRFTDYRFDYSEFKGNLWSSFSIKDLSVYQDQSPIVYVNDLDIQWQATSLFDSQFIFDHIRATFNLPESKTSISEQRQSGIHDQDLATENYQAWAQEIQKQIPALVINELDLILSHQDIDYKLLGNLDLIKTQGQLNFTQANHQTQVILGKDPDTQVILFNVQVQENTPGLLANTFNLSKDLYPLSADLNVTTQLMPEQLKLHFDDSQLMLSDQTIHIQGQSSLTDSRHVLIEGLKIAFNEGSLNVKADLNQDNLNGKIEIYHLYVPDNIIRGLPVSNIQINGTLNMDGPWKKPKFQGSLIYQSDVLYDSLMAEPTQLRLQNDIQSNDTGLLLKTNIYINEQSAGDVSAGVPWSWLDQEHSKNTIQVKSNLDLEKINPLLNNMATFQQGEANLLLNIYQAEQAPSIDGQVVISNSSLKDKAEYLHIEDLNLELALDKSRNIHLKNLQGKMNQGQLKATGSYKGDDVNLKYELTGMRMPKALDDNPVYAKAKITSMGTLSGSVGEPMADILLSIDNIEVPDNEYQSNQILNLQSAIGTKQQNLNADVKLLHNEAVISQVQVHTPMRTFVNNLNHGQIDIQIKSILNLSLIPTLFSIQDLSTQGQLKSNIKVFGKVESPQLLGHITLEKGRIHQKSVGLELNNIELKANAKDDKLFIERLVAHDSEKGQLDIKGTILLSAPQKLDITSTLTHFKLLNSAKYNGYAEGEMKVGGIATSPDIFGQLTFNDVNIQIPDIESHSVDSLDVIDAESYKAQQESMPLSEQYDNEGELDVKLNFPKRIFIRGKGLDAELGGQMDLTGSLQNPRLHGYIAMKRGSYEFLNKRFKITNGKVGIYEQDIRLDFTAEHKAKDLTAIIDIKGTPDNIKLNLSSKPTLPQDEILARLIFGKDSTSLSPIQALQLANAVRQLTSPNSSNSLDLLNETRAFLKVDELEINSSEDSQVSVGAGKYLTDKIYIKGEQGVTTNSTKMTVNVEVTDHITVESSTGADSKNNNIKVFWKKKY